ncbi:MAG: 5-(carboxyamino)imidazole ribonucleotide mutase [Bacteroidales bacterium]|nr:5-(carboxyamino)imidazole ribonucleotide mutase [Bacteroidales bacterium]MBQ1937847.1 5-(carboxyamino)imidazole ribonucleotide mutase [Bacteroidales bacterium]
MKVAVVMGSTSDWDVMKGACDVLEEFGVDYEKKVYSAHRTPAEFSEYVNSAPERGIGVIIAGAGGAAHLAGVAAGHTILPVIGVPIRSKALGGLDSLLSMVQMPSGIPVSTVAIDGAKNAALIAISIFALTDPALSEKLAEFRRKQAEKVLSAVL